MSEIQLPYAQLHGKRSLAKAAGAKRYFNGKACPNGHIADRFTSSGRCSLCTAAQRDQFRADNPGYEAQRYIKNRDAIIATNKAWQSANPAALAAQSRRYYARKLGAKGDHTVKDVQYILKMQKMKCAECRCCLKKRHEVDHIMPLSKGGSNCRKNLQALCRSCNARKAAKTPEQWALQNGRLL